MFVRILINSVLVFSLCLGPAYTQTLEGFVPGETSASHEQSKVRIIGSIPDPDTGVLREIMILTSVGTVTALLSHTETGGTVQWTLGGSPEAFTLEVSSNGQFGMIRADYDRHGKQWYDVHLNTEHSPDVVLDTVSGQLQDQALYHALIEIAELPWSFTDRDSTVASMLGAAMLPLEAGMIRVSRRNPSDGCRFRAHDRQSCFDCCEHDALWTGVLCSATGLVSPVFAVLCGAGITAWYFNCRKHCNKRYPEKKQPVSAADTSF